MNGLVLVTGGAGFIGSHVVDRLVAAGFKVRVLDDLSSGTLENIRGHLDAGRAEFIQADIRGRDAVYGAMDKVDAVVHLAAVTSVPFSMEHPALTKEVNVAGTHNLVSSCANTNVRRFVFVSSCAVYGEPKYLPLDEDHPKNPVSPYAATKLLGEACCRSFSYNSLGVVVLRLFNVYGPRQGKNSYSGVISCFLRDVRRGLPLTVFGDGRQTRDFVHVYDVADAVVETVRNQDVKGVFNIGSGEATPINKLAGLVQRNSGRGFVVVYSSPRPGDVLNSYANISKAKQAWGYKPKIRLEKGILDLMRNPNF